MTTKTDLLPLLGSKENVLDGITGFVEHYDFALANSSYEARVHAVTKVASICYANPKALDSVSLFDRLAAESGGLPSSSYEFVPVLLRTDQEDAENDQVTQIFNSVCGEDTHNYEDLNTVKFGEKISTSSAAYLLTNLRALIEDVGPDESLNYLNTSDEEIQIIRDNFKVFLFNVDLSTRAQMVRHRVSWQELSRRYVSGKKKEFEFYVSKKLEAVAMSAEGTSIDDDVGFWYPPDTLIELCVAGYNQAIASGVKPEEARRILPQAMMTQIWGAFQPKQLEGFFKLRLHKTAQREIQNVAEAMRELI